jgi:hypothetical protein
MMKSKDLLSLALKVIGVFVLLRSIELLPFIIQSVLWDGLDHFKFNSNFVIMSLLLLATYCGVGFLLIGKSRKLAGFICKKDSDINIPATAQELQIITFSCIGIWLICSAGAYLLTSFVSSLHGEGFAKVIQLKSTIQNVFRVLIGLILFVQSRGLATLFAKLSAARNPVRSD